MSPAKSTESNKTFRTWTAPITGRSSGAAESYELPHSAAKSRDQLL